jgi:hypothetical protein
VGSGKGKQPLKRASCCLCHTNMIWSLSERGWKAKLKEWQFEKYLSTAEMKVLLAKGQKRLRDEGKKTTFLRHGLEIKEEKFENFKKRMKIDGFGEPPFVSAGEQTLRFLRKEEVSLLTNDLQQRPQRLPTTPPGQI